MLRTPLRSNLNTKVEESSVMVERVSTKDEEEGKSTYRIRGTTSAVLKVVRGK